jgi:hypothetical protein
MGVDAATRSMTGACRRWGSDDLRAHARGPSGGARRRLIELELRPDLFADARVEPPIIAVADPNGTGSWRPRPARGW